MRTVRGAAAAFLVLLVAAGAAAKDLAWRAFDVKARLDASGALHVVETQTMVFDGDWNGGERTFRVFPGQGLAFESITRVDPDGTRHPVTAGDLSAVDEYKFVSDHVVRWRSRRPSDPPFDHTERVYEIAYTLTGILVRQGDRFVLDHDFAFPDRQYPIQKFTLTLALDPAWKPQSPQPERFESGVLSPGRGYVLRVELAYAGSGAPLVDHVPPAQAVASPSLRRAVLAAFGIGVALLFFVFRRHEAAVGLFAPGTPPDRIDQAWLEKNLLSLSPEEAGALWDEKVGPPEVAAVLARLAAEKKISSQPDGKKLTMRLLAPLPSFRDYEHELLTGLFFGGRKETDTDAIKAHYKSSGFDPASKIKKGLEAKLSAHADFGDSSSAPSKWPTAVLFLVGLASLAAALFLGDVDPGLVVSLAITLGFLYAIAMGCAYVFRRRVAFHATTWLLILWMPLLLLYFAWLGAREGNRELVLFVVGSLLAKLAVIRSVFDFAQTRDGPKRAPCDARIFPERARPSRAAPEGRLVPLPRRVRVDVRVRPMVPRARQSRVRRCRIVVDGLVVQRVDVLRKRIRRLDRRRRHIRRRRGVGFLGRRGRRARGRRRRSVVFGGQWRWRRRGRKLRRRRRGRVVAGLPERRSSPLLRGGIGRHGRRPVESLSP